MRKYGKQLKNFSDQLNKIDQLSFSFYRSWGHSKNDWIIVKWHVTIVGQSSTALNTKHAFGCFFGMAVIQVNINYKSFGDMFIVQKYQAGFRLLCNKIL